jgi:hypothetical protein
MRACVSLRVCVYVCVSACAFAEWCFVGLWLVSVLVESLFLMRANFCPDVAGFAKVEAQ